MKINSLIKSINHGIKSAKIVKKKYGVSFKQQFCDIYHLRKNNAGISDYYEYRIFDPERHPTLEDKLSYSGWRAFDGEFRKFSEKRLQALAYEKHIFYRLCQSFELPVPEIYKVYSPRYDGFERHKAITNISDLKDYLENTDNIPFFGKPSNANC